MHLVLVLWVVADVAAGKYSEYEARSSQYDYGEQGAIPIRHSVEEQKAASQPGEYGDNEYIDAEQEFVWENILQHKSSKHKTKEKYTIPEFRKTSPIDESDDDVETINKSNFRNRKTINEVLRYTIKSRRSEIKDDVVLRRSTLSINPFEDTIPNDEDQEPVDNITNGKSDIELTEKRNYKQKNRDMNLADEGDYTKIPSVSRKHRVGKQRRGLQQSTEPSKNEDYIYDDVKRLRKYEQNITASQNMTASTNTITLKWGSEMLLNLYESSTLKQQTTTDTTSYDLEVNLDDGQLPMFTVRQPYQDHHFYESIGKDLSDYFRDLMHGKTNDPENVVKTYSTRSHIFDVPMSSGNELSTGETSAMPQEDQQILVTWLDGSTPDPSQQKNPKETKNIPDRYLEKAKEIIRGRLLNQPMQDVWVSNKRDILVCGYIELSLLENSSTVVLVNHFILMLVCGLLLILN